MKYNLTDSQKDLARFFVKEVRAGNLEESFIIIEGADRKLLIPELKFEGSLTNDWGTVDGAVGQLDALVQAKLLLQKINSSNRSCTLTGAIYLAVDSNFAEEPTAAPVSTLAQPHPPEIAMSIDRLRTKYPDAKKVGFLVMRFTAAKPFACIVEVIKETAAKYGVTIIRADENEFHADLWGNVRTHLHGCGFGIAVYERIESNEPNANVGLEVGYLMAMNKPVLLLKDQTVQTLQSDLAGKLYKQFDPHDPVGTLPAQIKKWLEDNGIIVPQHAYSP